MKRRSLLFVVVAAALLALPATAIAHPLPNAAHAQAAGTAAFGPVRAAARLSTSFALTGTGVLSVTVQDSHGAAQSGVDVGWLVWGSGVTPIATGVDQKTGATGDVQFRNVPASSGNGEIWASGPSCFYDIVSMDWPDAATTAYTFEPARQAVSFTRQSGSPWEDVYMDVATRDGSGDKLSETVISGTTATVSGTANVLPGAMTGAAAYFYSDEGAEMATTGMTAVAGADTSATLSCNETTDAQYADFTDWSSGKPGGKDTLYLAFPQGWTNDLTGFDRDTGRPSSLDSTWTSTSSSSPGKKVITVPTSIKPGHTYVVDVQHQNGLLDLRAAYQVCTLNASSASIRKGQSVRLSGVVPANAAAKRLVDLQAHHLGRPAAEERRLGPRVGLDARRLRQVHQQGRLQQVGHVRAHHVLHRLVPAGRPALGCLDVGAQGHGALRSG